MAGMKQLLESYEKVFEKRARLNCIWSPIFVSPGARFSKLPVITGPFKEGLDGGASKTLNTKIFPSITSNS